MVEFREFGRWVVNQSLDFLHGKCVGCRPNIISRFDALISDRQVEGDRSLTTPNEPAIWVPTKTETKDTPRVVAKASKKSKK